MAAPEEHKNPQLLSLAVEKAWQVRSLVGQQARLSQLELSALQFLADRVAGPAELSRALAVSTAAVTGLVDRLVARGYIERTPDPEDRRRTAIHLTRSGRRSLVEHLQPMLIALRDLDADFTAAESAAVERYLLRAIDAFEQVVAPGGASPS
ncbi:MarR family transcriptional regulator [Mumia zhuanghuii]|uniref:MarR family winged helix-turn-helix transcriptional regulator n=2 Tax=Mumia TaxID=1546255 RepID=A0ABW1QHR2_9ACTN|nr:MULTISPECIES: MarR family transcriptional regulator [Mumia]KAA1422993.1 MarR family transcriptional regulator [Mumia zhuanghuii]